MVLERVWKMLSAKWGVLIAGMVFQKCSYHRKKYNKINKTGAVENYRIFHCA